MVDIMSHGGDAGGDPPHPGDSWIPGACESYKFQVFHTFVLD